MKNINELVQVVYECIVESPTYFKNGTTISISCDFKTISVDFVKLGFPIFFDTRHPLFYLNIQKVLYIGYADLDLTKVPDLDELDEWFNFSLMYDVQKETVEKFYIIKEQYYKIIRRHA